MPALYEADLSAQQPPAQADAWLSRADADPFRARDSFGASPQGAQKTLSVNSGPVVGERFSRDDRLRKRREFEECYASGVRVSGRHLQLFLLARPEERHARIGIAVPRRAGNAVTRNRLRRQLREIFRRNRQRLLQPRGLRLVVHIRPSAAQASFSDLERDYLSTVGRAMSLIGGER